MMTSPLSLGSYGGGWDYYKDRKLYDVSRDAIDPFYSFDTTQGPPDTTVLIGVRLTALVIVDMQNFFLHPRCNDYPEGREAAERVLEVIAKCRELKIQIIWLNWGLTEQDIRTMPPAVDRSFASQLMNEKEDGKMPEGTGQSRRGLGSDMGSGRGKLLKADSWNAELYDPLLQVSDNMQDIFCDKNRMSGLWSETTELHQAIEGEFVTLLFAGVNTDQCVLGTLVDAYNRGFDCVMLDDCCATKTPGGKESTIWNVSRSYGFVTDSKSFCNGVGFETEGEKLSFLGVPKDSDAS
ncbi:Isochorismatase-like protein [Xylaria sp. FL1042]|nr:Isochorismatase-like protein [Xylaria sp. FL1042]